MVDTIKFQELVNEQLSTKGKISPFALASSSNGYSQEELDAAVSKFYSEKKNLIVSDSTESQSDESQSESPIQDDPTKNVRGLLDKLSASPGPEGEDKGINDIAQLVVSSADPNLAPSYSETDPITEGGDEELNWIGRARERRRDKKTAEKRKEEAQSLHEAGFYSFGEERGMIPQPDNLGLGDQLDVMTLVFENLTNNESYQANLAERDEEINELDEQFGDEAEALFYEGKMGEYHEAPFGVVKVHGPVNIFRDGRSKLTRKIQERNDFVDFHLNKSFNQVYENAYREMIIDTEPARYDFDGEAIEETNEHREWALKVAKLEGILMNNNGLIVDIDKNGAIGIKNSKLEDLGYDLALGLIQISDILIYSLTKPAVVLAELGQLFRGEEAGDSRPASFGLEDYTKFSQSTSQAIKAERTQNSRSLQEDIQHQNLDPLNHSLEYIDGVISGALQSFGYSFLAIALTAYTKNPTATSAIMSYLVSAQEYDKASRESYFDDFYLPNPKNGSQERVEDEDLIEAIKLMYKDGTLVFHNDGGGVQVGDWTSGMKYIEVPMPVYNQSLDGQGINISFGGTRKVYVKRNLSKRWGFTWKQGAAEGIPEAVGAGLLWKTVTRNQARGFVEGMFLASGVGAGTNTIEEGTTATLQYINEKRSKGEPLNMNELWARVINESLTGLVSGTGLGAGTYAVRDFMSNPSELVDKYTRAQVNNAIEDKDILARIEHSKEYTELDDQRAAIVADESIDQSTKDSQLKEVDARMEELKRKVGKAGDVQEKILDHVFKTDPALTQKITESFIRLNRLRLKIQNGALGSESTETAKAYLSELLQKEVENLKELIKQADLTALLQTDIQEQEEGILELTPNLTGVAENLGISQEEFQKLIDSGEWTALSLSSIAEMSKLDGVKMELLSEAEWNAVVKNSDLTERIGALAQYDPTTKVMSISPGADGFAVIEEYLHRNLDGAETLSVMYEDVLASSDPQVQLIIGDRKRVYPTEEDLKLDPTNKNLPVSKEKQQEEIIIGVLREGYSVDTKDPTLIELQNIVKNQLPISLTSGRIAEASGLTPSLHVGFERSRADVSFQELEARWRNNFNTMPSPREIAESLDINLDNASISDIQRISEELMNTPGMMVSTLSTRVDGSKRPTVARLRDAVKHNKGYNSAIVVSDIYSFIHSDPNLFNLWKDGKEITVLDLRFDQSGTLTINYTDADGKPKSTEMTAGVDAEMLSSIADGKSKSVGWLGGSSTKGKSTEITNLVKEALLANGGNVNDHFIINYTALGSEGLISSPITFVEYFNRFKNDGMSSENKAEVLVKAYQAYKSEYIEKLGQWVLEITDGNGDWVKTINYKTEINAKNGLEARKGKEGDVRGYEVKKVKKDALTQGGFSRAQTLDGAFVRLKRLLDNPSPNNSQWKKNVDKITKEILNQIIAHKAGSKFSFADRKFLISQIESQLKKSNPDLGLLEEALEAVRSKDSKSKTSKLRKEGKTQEQQLDAFKGKTMGFAVAQLRGEGDLRGTQIENTGSNEATLAFSWGIPITDGRVVVPKAIGGKHASVHDLYAYEEAAEVQNKTNSQFNSSTLFEMINLEAAADRAFAEKQANITDAENQKLGGGSASISSSSRYKNMPKDVTVRWVETRWNTRGTNFHQESESKTFADGWHFYNWWVQMTGNGSVEALNNFAWQKEGGEWNSIKDIQPKKDRATGEKMQISPKYMSWQQKTIIRNLNTEEKRKADEKDRWAEKFKVQQLIDSGETPTTMHALVNDYWDPNMEGRRTSGIVYGAPSRGMVTHMINKSEQLINIKDMTPGDTFKYNFDISKYNEAKLEGSSDVVLGEHSIKSHLTMDQMNRFFDPYKFLFEADSNVKQKISKTEDGWNMEVVLVVPQEYSEAVKDFESKEKPITEAELLQAVSDLSDGVKYDDSPSSARIMPAKLKHVGWKRFFYEWLVDKHGGIIGEQEEVEKKTGKLPQKQNFKGIEQLMYGKTAHAIEGLDKQLAVATKFMRENKITSSDLNLLMYALHAVERNAHIAKNRPNMLSGSGMSNERAAEIISELGSIPHIRDAANMFYEIQQETRNIYRKFGLETDEKIDNWEKLYSNYVPLTGFADDEGTNNTAYPTGGPGFGVYGPAVYEKAVGRETEAANVLANIIFNHGNAIQLAEKNFTLTSLHDLIEAQPSPDIWKVADEKNPLMRTNDKGERVPMSVFEMKSDPSTVAVRINGEQKFLVFSDPYYAATLNGMTMEDTNTLIRMMRAPASWLRNVFTVWSPNFFVGNFARDLGTSMYSAASDVESGTLVGADGKPFSILDIQKKTITNTFVSLKAIMKERVMGKEMTPEMQKWYAEWKEAGGQTGWGYNKDLNAIIEELSKQTDVGDLTLGQKAARKIFETPKSFLKLVEGVNEAFENSIRLSSYITAREAGATAQDAAIFSKNITVNFNRGGEAGPLFNSIYLFFNAQIQGNLRLYNSLAKGKDIRKPDGSLDSWHKRVSTPQKIAAGMAGFSGMLTMLNIALSGEDEDGVSWYKKMSDYDKSKNMIICYGPNRDDFLKIPLPYGYGVFNNMGMVATEVGNGTRSPESAMLLLSETAVGAFSPFDVSGITSGDLLPTALPSVLKGFAETAKNETHWGSSITNEQSPYGTPLPNSELSRRSPEALRNFAHWMNEATGGSKFKSGDVDVNPDKLWFLFEYFMGGTGDFVMDSGKMAKNMYEMSMHSLNEAKDAKNVSGVLDALGSGFRAPNKAKVHFNEVPLVKKLYGEASPFYDIDNFRNNEIEINQLYKEISNNVLIDDPKRYKGVQVLHTLLKKTKKDLKQIRAALRDAKEIEDWITRHNRIFDLYEGQRKAMVRFNKKYNEVRGKKED